LKLHPPSKTLLTAGAGEDETRSHGNLTPSTGKVGIDQVFVLLLQLNTKEKQIDDDDDDDDVDDDDDEDDDDDDDDDDDVDDDDVVDDDDDDQAGGGGGGDAGDSDAGDVLSTLVSGHHILHG